MATKRHSETRKQREERGSQVNARFYVLRSLTHSLSRSLCVLSPPVAGGHKNSLTYSVPLYLLDFEESGQMF